MIQDGNEEYCIYPLDEFMEILGSKWTLLVIGVLGNRKRIRFNEIANTLQGISPRTLTSRLRNLESLGLVRREAYTEVPLRVEYSLSKKGKQLRKAIIPLLAWAEENVTS